MDKIVTPINADILEQLLHESNYNREKRDYLINGFCKGFSIEYTGPQKRQDYSKNLLLRSGTKTMLWNKLIKEVQLNRICGPFTTIPYDTWIQSPVTLIPKNSGKDSRLVFDLSHSFGERPSVNEVVPLERKTVQYQDLRSAMEIILEEEDGVNQLYLGKLDALSAFRNIPLAASESRWLVMKANHPQMGVTYFFTDRTLSFGHCLSCRIYQEFALAVGHIFHYRTGRRINSYLDDVLMARLLKDHCALLMEQYQHLCQLIGLPLSPEKTEGPATIIVFLGMLINAMDRTIGIPVDKINRALGELTHLLRAKKATVHYLQKLTGLLNFFCTAIYPGKAFTRRMYSKFSGSGLQKYHHVQVDKELQKDCQMWKTFLLDPDNYTRPFTDFSIQLNALELKFFTYASFKVCAGYFDGRYFVQSWEHDIIENSEANISLMELYAITVAIHLWAKYLKNMRVVIFSDSESSVTMVNRASSKCPRCMHLIRHITLVSMEHNVRFFLRHIKGKFNTIADLLSRGRVSECRRMLPKGKLLEPPETMPKQLWPIPLNWWVQ